MHGAFRWYKCELINRLSIQPYEVSPTENRKQVFRFATSQQYATIDPENEPYQPRPCLQTQNKYLWANVFKQCASTVLNQSGVERRVASATQPELSAVQRYEAGQFTDAEPNAKEPLRT